MNKYNVTYIYLFTPSSFFADFAECTYKHVTTLDDEMVTMEILDTAGQVKKNEKVDKLVV